MKITNTYKELNIANEESAFKYLLDTLKETIKTYDFYVAWNKVLGNVNKIEIPLNILNSLIGKNNIELELRSLIVSYPEIVPIIPILIASRDKKLMIADIGGDIEYDFSYKKNYNDNEIDKIIKFAKESKFLQIISDKKIKNLVDYCIGVEVGLDTNARKNRSGTAMEKLIELYVKKICEDNNFNYISQATANRIKKDFNYDVPTDKADRHFDFAIKAKEKLYLLEVNYYGGGGSKLKSVAGEFKSLSQLIRTRSDITFIWITDGKGWLTAKRPLEETFIETDYVMNINMIEDGILNEIIKKGL